MRKRSVTVNSYPGVAGEIHGSFFTREIHEDDDYLNGVALSDELLDKLVDENVSLIVLTRNGKRHMSTIEDWQEYGKPGGDYDDVAYTYLPFSYMREN